MRCAAVLAATLLGQLAVRPHAIQMREETRRTIGDAPEFPGRDSMYGHAVLNLDELTEAEPDFEGIASVSARAARIGRRESMIQIDDLAARAAALAASSEALDGDWASESGGPVERVPDAASPEENGQEEQSSEGQKDEALAPEPEESSEEDRNEARPRVSVTLSPEERLQAHAQKYEAEFVVELNMTEAHETGTKMGIVLNRDADFMAATVFRVQKTGMIEAWNRANPDKAVHVGDEIVRVNDVQWHANTEMFIKRIIGQFNAGRREREGASDVLKLYFQRPRKWEHSKFAQQREDAHNKTYAAEFVATLPMPDDLSSSTLDSVMGWKLGMTEEWKPITIRRIERHGSVAAWNHEHPDELILEGDEIMKVDNVVFHHSSSTFEKTLRQHYRKASAVEATKRSALVSIRRPREVQDAFDAVHPVQDIVAWQRPQHLVTLEFDQVGNPTSLLGWQIVHGRETDSGESGPMKIKKVKPKGIVSEWNERHRDRSIAPGDEIVEVNGISWELYETAHEFADLVQSVLESAASKGPGGEPVELTLQRSTKYVRHVRKNMEHGVHMRVTAVTTSEGPQFHGYPNATDDDDDDVTGAEDDSDGVLLDGSKAEEKAVTTSVGVQLYGYPNATHDDSETIGAENDSDSLLLNAPQDEESAATTTDDDAAPGSEDESVRLPKRVLLLDTVKDAPTVEQRLDTQDDAPNAKTVLLLDTMKDAPAVEQSLDTQEDAQQAEPRRKVLSLLDTLEKS
mmetsp:Transcript_11931/g.32355  ORF Transcript_11931/g.32355 Transcript_11931/m.32355 type:complete len:743 (-) Transcript_11931:249-2477(-)